MDNDGDLRRKQEDVYNEKTMGFVLNNEIINNRQH